MWREYFIPQSLDDALRLLSEHQGQARIIAGGTDLVIELDRHVRPPSALIDVSRLSNLDDIRLDEGGVIHLGPLTTHNDVIASALCVERAFPLAQACRHVGAPQIRNRATVAGNLITASPANDSIAPLTALDAALTLRSLHGERRVPLAEFYTGVRKTVMQPDEMLVDIAFRALQPNQAGAFIKLALRRAQAISLVNCCAILTMDDRRQVIDARLTLGAVAPTVIRIGEAEAVLIGQSLSEDVIEHAAVLARRAAKPIDDVRASADYRSDMASVIVHRALTQVMNGCERSDWGGAPALLWTNSRPGKSEQGRRGDDYSFASSAVLVVTINGREFQIADSDAREKTLLRLLREDCALIGTKEGCSEGECGACTVILDGKAVMACLTPAPRASGAMVTTIEGVNGVNGVNGLKRINGAGGASGELHRLQQAFIDAGAVQCGYCTPGFIMSGAALLAEHPQPTEAQIKESISGNLCRCTGYYKIIEAFHRAAATHAAKEE